MRTTLFLSIATIFALLTVSCGPDNEDWKITQDPNGSYNLQLADVHLGKISISDHRDTTIATEKNLTNLFITMDRNLKPRVHVVFRWSGEIRQTYEIKPNDLVPNLFCFVRDFTYASRYEIENNRNIFLDDAKIHVLFSEDESKAIIRYLHQGSYDTYAFTTYIKKKRLHVTFSNVEHPIKLEGFEKIYQKFIEKNKSLEYDEYTGMFK